MSLENLFPGSEVIHVCSIQAKCNGNRAVGTVEFYNGEEQLNIPICQECQDHLEVLREQRLTDLRESGTLD